MIEKHIKFTAVLFGEYEDITPNNKNIYHFLSRLERFEFAPSNSKRMVIEDDGMRFIDTFSLESDDKMWDVEFVGNRINITKSFSEKHPANEPEEISNFLGDATLIYDVIHEKFPDKLHHRLSLVTAHLLNNIGTEKMSILFKEMLTPIDFYAENEPYEWNSRFVAKIPTSINDKEEKINIITNFDQTTYLSDNANYQSKLRILFDINTDQLNTESRFTMNDIRSFLNIAANKRQEVYNQYKEKILLVTD